MADWIRSAVVFLLIRSSSAPPARRIWTMLPVLVVLLLGMSAAPVAAQNLITNGDCPATGPAGWSSTNVDCQNISGSFPDAPSSGQTGSLYFATVNSGQGQASQTITGLAGGATYDFEVYLATFDTTPQQDGMIVTLQFQDGSGSNLGSAVTLVDTDANNSYPSSSTWERRATSGITAPSGTAQAVLTAEFIGDGNGFVDTFLDAFSLVQTSAPPTNTAPTASGTISPTSLNDDAGPTALFDGIDVSDSDPGETDLALRVTVAVQSAGVISGVNGTSVTNEGGGVFSVAGSFDPSTIDTALDNLRFNPTDNTGSSGTFNTDLTVQVDDQESGFVDVSGPTTVTITRINDAPTVATNQTLSLNEGASADLSQGLLEATDPDDAASALTYTIDTDVQNGQIVNTSTSTQLDQSDTFTQANINSGDIEYRHDGSETTADAFDFTVTDGNGSASGTFDVSITPANDKPVATADDFTGGSGTDEDTPLSVSTRSGGVLPNDTDEDDGNADLSVAGVEGGFGNTGSPVTLASGATVSVGSDGTFTYDPNGQFESLGSGDNTTDSFTYTTEDDGGAVSSSATVTVQVNGVNDAPSIAGDQSLSTSEGTGVTLAGADLDAVDPDDAASALTYTIDTDVQNGQIVNTSTSTQLDQSDTFTQANINSGDIEYRHDGSETTADAFDFTVTDGNGGSASGTFDVSVSPQNDAPVATADDFTGGSGTDEDTPLSVSTRAGGVLPNDTDPDDSNANLSVAGVEGGSGNTGSPVTLASGATVSVGSDGTFTYDPNGQFESLGSGDNTTDSFTYTTADDDGAVSSSATVTVQVNGVNDAPVFTNPGTFPASATFAENSTGSIVDVDANGGDGGGTDGSITYTLGGADGGRFSIDADGQLTFDSPPDFEAPTDSDDNNDYVVEVIADDGESSNNTTTGTITVTVTDANEAPVANADDFTGGSGTDEEAPLSISDRSTGLLPNDTDPDDSNADLSVAGVEGGSGNTGSPVTLTSGATVSVGSDGTFTYAPNGQFESLGSGDNTTDSFTYTTEDDGGAVSSSATVTVQVNGVNDGPSIAGDQSLSLNEGAGVTLASADLDGVDPDDGASGLTYKVTSAPSTGEVQVGGTQASSFTEADLDNGDVTYVHDDSETGSDAFDVALADGEEDGASAATATISVSITLQNDAPTITGLDNDEIDEIGVGGTLEPVRFTVEDEETDDGNLSLSGSSDNTTLVPDANITFGGSDASRTITVTPADGEEGTATITVTVTDGGGKTASTSFNLTVDATPDLALRDGSAAGLDVPARVRPGTDANPLGTFSLSASRSGASLDGLTVTNSAPGTEGITRARLFWSTDKHLDVGTDTELDRVSINPSEAPQTITFGGFNRPIPTAARYAIIALDVAPGVTAETVKLTLAQTADLQTPGGEIETINETTPSSFPNPALSNGTTRLPLRLSDFGATLTQDGGSTEREQLAVGDRVVRITWQATDEQNNKGFEVQRKQAGAPATAWAKVGFVESTSAGSAQTNGPGKSTKAATKYRFDDVVSFTADSLEYRLRQESTDGSASFYKPATVTSGTVQQVQLLGTFPNPARSQATVRFAVPEGKAADVTLRLYDLLGRQVQTVRRAADAGRHELQLDVGGLASGVYFLRLGADGTVETRKMTVVR
jgi:VCBS repeat-containing protein